MAAKHDAWKQRQSQAQVATLAASRAALPIAQHRGPILEAVAAHQVVLIAGETGCGKTTQVRCSAVEVAVVLYAALHALRLAGQTGSQ